MEKDKCEVCQAHSGMLKSISILEQSEERQWKAIEAIKNWRNTMLTGIVLTLIATIAGLVLK